MQAALSTDAEAKRQMLRESEASLRACIAMDAADPRSYVVLGKLLMQQKRYDEARKLYANGTTATGQTRGALMQGLGWAGGFTRCVSSGKGGWDGIWLVLAVWQLCRAGKLLMQQMRYGEARKLYADGTTATGGQDGVRMQGPVWGAWLRCMWGVVEMRASWLAYVSVGGVARLAVHAYPWVLQTHAAKSCWASYWCSRSGMLSTQQVCTTRMQGPGCGAGLFVGWGPGEVLMLAGLCVGGWGGWLCMHICGLCRPAQLCRAREATAAAEAVWRGAQAVRRHNSSRWAERPCTGPPGGWLIRVGRLAGRR
jgi:hypothetical protein